MTDIWDQCGTMSFANEAAVELRFITPLLEALGYGLDEIASKHPVKFQEGKTGRPHEADLVVFEGTQHDRDHSLLTIEAKAPSDSIDGAKAQAESYAQNLRTPFFLITNGVEFEIWQSQIAGESTKLIRCRITEIYANRSSIERCIGREAACKYAHDLRRPDVNLSTIDLTAYLQAELARTDPVDPVIERSLGSPGPKSGDLANSGELVATHARGALILGASGFGKSTLAIQLLRRSLFERLSSASHKFGCAVWLPDVAAVCTSIASTAHKRIAASCVALSEASFLQLLRDEGGILICDGFDRLSAENSPRMEADLRDLLRDYPKLQIFVFSRPSVKPDLDLPILLLGDLTNEEQRDLFQKVYADGSTAGMALHSLPRPLRSLLFHPLLLSLIAKYGVSEDSKSVRIENIFHEWLEKLLQTAASSPSARVKLNRGLTLLAQATVESPIAMDCALELLELNNLPTSVFDQLVQCDAVSVRDSTIELQHESLADYLRALSIASLEQNFIAYLEKTDTLKDSLLPILLMALLKNREQQQALWKRLQSVSLSAYLDALRFRGDIGQEFAENDKQLAAKQYLEDLLDGLEGPLISFFPQMRDAVVSNLTDGQQGLLGIFGFFDADRQEAGYTFRVVAHGEERVVLGKPSHSDSASFWISLKRSGFRLDSGRLLGALKLRECLLAVVATREFNGGRHWLTERLLGRVRYLEVVHWDFRPRAYNLDSLAEKLDPDKERYVRIGNSNKRIFYVQDMINDIHFLQKVGDFILQPWWLSHVTSTTLRPQTQEQYSKVLDDHFRRTILTYYEVCEQNLSCFKNQLGYAIAPVRNVSTPLRHKAQKISVVLQPAWDSRFSFWHAC